MSGTSENSFHVPSYLLRMLRDYLKGRSLVYETLEGERRMEITSGVAQGFVLGPNLWNAPYDSLLRLDMPEDSRLVGYADDVVALVAGLTGKRMDDCSRFQPWAEKTEVVILTRRRIPTLLLVGPIYTRRRLLMGAMQSVLLYDTEVWADALEKAVHRKRLVQVQRRRDLRVASAYRTVSEPAVMVIVGVIRLVLFAEERKAIYRHKSENAR